MLRPLSAALCAAALCIALPSIASANDGAFYGQGSTVFPVKDDAIALDTEVLSIKQGGSAVGYYVDHWRVEVTYAFRNTTDKPVEVQMGFPEWCEATPDNQEELQDGKCSAWTIRDFAIFIDGKKAPKATIKKAEPGKGPLTEMHYDRVHTFPVEFGPGQTRTVRHTYRHASSLTSPWCSDLTYILKTGALWKGKMRSLDISVETFAEFAGEMDYAREWLEGKDGRPKATVKSKPDGGQLFTWALKDVEPQHDLAIMFCEPKVMLARYEAIDAVLAMEKGDLEAQSKADLRRLRNTIYAAHGYTFKSADLQTYFGEKPWYRPRADYDPKWLTKRQLERVALIKKLEKARK